MNLKDFIDSGILELYVLELLPQQDRDMIDLLLAEFPDLKAEVHKVEIQQERKVMEQEKACRTSFEEMQEIMLNSAKEQKMHIDDLPLINKHSDYKKWHRLVHETAPEALLSDNYQRVLRSENGVTQVLVVSAFDIPDELHDDSYESFLILKGECRCTVGDDVFGLTAGGFTEIPLNENHKVEVIKAPVMAIVQYVAA